MRVSSLPAGLVSLAVLGCAPADQKPAPPPIDHVGRVTSSLVPGVQVKGAPVAHYEIVERMKHYHTPGLTIAVVDSGRIVWARGFGVKEAGGSGSITPPPVVGSGAISKPLPGPASLPLVVQS